MPISPQFNGQPVIVVHIAEDELRGLDFVTLCSGDIFHPPGNSYKNFPLVPCTGCHNAMKRKDNGN